MKDLDEGCTFEKWWWSYNIIIYSIGLYPEWNKVIFKGFHSTELILSIEKDSVYFNLNMPCRV